PTTEPAADQPTDQPIVESQARQAGDEPQDERQFAPDPFTVATDPLAGVKLLLSRRFRRAEIEFADGKPSQPVIDKLKEREFRWEPKEKIWIRPMRTADAVSTRIEAERTHKEVSDMIRDEKGLGREKAAF
ncbi:MAG TPA: hypothetical protein VM165_18135, partial [Planctomycetaceae bacterium]|nr:hypothetical protein [Planctomycetaceae bacterium]